MSLLSRRHSICKSPEVVKNLAGVMNRGLVWWVEGEEFQDESRMVR